MKLRLNQSQLLTTFLNLMVQDKATERYDPEILGPLCTILSQLGVSSKSDGLWAARIIMHFLVEEDRFEDKLVSDARSLLLFMTVFLIFAYTYKDDAEHPDFSRKCLSAIGNLSTRPGFSETVQISERNTIFNHIVSLLDGQYSIPDGFVTGDDTGPLKYSLFSGISCVMLGNLALSPESLQDIFRQVPDIVSTAMNYFAGETDPYGLQGAHLIKNITVVPQAQYSAAVLQRGGASLVHKLVNQHEFTYLRSLGAQIAQNLLRYSSHLGSLEAALDYSAIVRALYAVYYGEKDVETKHEILLACDASVAELLLYDATDGDEEATEFLDAETQLSKLFIYYLHSLYTTGAKIHVPVAVKVTKSLGVLSDAPALKTRQQLDPTTTISILDHTISSDPASLAKLIDILGKFSTQLAAAQPKVLHISNEEAVATTFKGIINNLGYVGSKMIEYENEDLAKACQIAMQNAYAVI